MFKIPPTPNKNGHYSFYITKNKGKLRNIGKLIQKNIILR